MNCKKIKKVFFSLLFSTLILGTVFPQEEFEDDDFDSLFEDAEDDVVVEQSTPVTPQQETSGIASKINFFGHLESTAGAQLTFSDNKITPSAGISKLTASLGMKARPNPLMSVNAGVSSSLANKFTIDLGYLYFDYLLLDKVYVYVGKKGTSLGGYTIHYSESCLTDSSGLVVEMKYPWGSGTLTAFGSYDISELDRISKRGVTAGGELEQTIGHTSVNIFGKWYGAVGGVRKKPVAGLELKRTILDFDVYGQGTVAIADFNKLNETAGYERVAGTAGFYRYWNDEDPVFGVNFEHKFIWTPASLSPYSNSSYVQFGIGHLGKNKNVRIGLENQYEYESYSGHARLGLEISGILEYVSWVNGFDVSYSKNSCVPSIGTAISVALDY